MRTLRHTIGLLLAVALAGPASAAELTADEVVDRMLAANSAWLKADIRSVSYVVKQHRDAEQTITVKYRAPGDLRIERQPEAADLWFRGGAGFGYHWGVSALNWDADRIYDAAMEGLVLRGAAWILANHRDRCQVYAVRREEIGGRDGYRLSVGGCSPIGTGLYFPGPGADEGWSRYLWVDAETFRPLREAYDCAGIGEIIYCALRYQDYRPFPGGGEAPMRLESSMLPWLTTLPNADPEGEPGAVSTYQIVDGKYWFRKLTTQKGKPEDEVTEISTARVPTAAFEGPEFARLARAAELHMQAWTYKKEERWREFMSVCDEILAGGLGVASVRHDAIRLHFWHGDYRKVTEFAESSKGGRKDDDIYVAWAYDALGQGEKALEVYREIKARTVAGRETPEVEQGLKEPWVPIAKRLQPKDHERLLKPDGQWRAESNTVEGEHPETAIDGDRRSCWVSADRQIRGMWFQVGLGRPTALTRVAFDFVGDLNLTLYDGGYPNQYRVEVSADGEHWQTVAEGPGLRDNLVEAAIPPQPVRYVRMSLTGAAPRLWSIHEIFLYAPK